MLYTALKFVHILSAILAVGLNISYGVWLARAAREPEAMGFALRGIKFLDDNLATPGYIVLLGSGLLMAYVAKIPLLTFWVVASFVLYVMVAALGILFYSPTLERQIVAYEEDGVASAEFQRQSARGRALGLSMGLIVAIIIGLMVFKPSP